ncbi:protein brambleberry isoform X2 [Cryptotermes secundus]|uniref:protein brambleberry isoform X2 n=1 Tax=Cryptotermes secundus TaxID=105785 RepID=UPI001454BDAE|nr:protein brambleberry isoform X2 [Cryptotermes secundus]
MSTKALIICLFILLVGSGNASIIDWIWGGHDENAAPKPTIGGLPIVKIPFEIITDDEKFLREAKNYTSLKLEHLDDCQHHVVMRIHSACSDLTEEELSKMSVDLLNCQAVTKGWRRFLCTSRMSLQECTSSMDPDMWNAYHLMNNRARAICYAARSQQSRALSEMTVDKLMDSAHSQLNTMDSLKEDHQKLESLTASTLEAVSYGHQSLMDQQDKLRVTQHSIQDSVSLNLRQVTREKVLIASGHHELAKMMDDIRNKLDEASLELSSQVNERRENHKQQLEDLRSVVDQVAVFWQRIDGRTQEILAHHESATAQYDSAIYKLSQISTTVNFLLDLLDKTRHDIEHLGRLINLTPDTGNQLDHLYSCVLHFLYLIVGMITAAFFRAPTTSRAFLLLFVPLNLAVTYTHGDAAALNFPSMTILILASTAVCYVIQRALHYWTSRQPRPLSSLHGSQPQPMTSQFITNPLPCTKPVALMLSHRSSMNTLSLFPGDPGRCPSSMESMSVAASSRGDSPRPDERVRILTPVRDRNLGEGSSGSGEVALGLAHFAERSANSNSCSSNNCLVQAGTSRTLRQRYSSPVYFPPARKPTSSFSPPRPVCRAVCRNGQQCHTSASVGSDLCWRHTS